MRRLRLGMMSGGLSPAAAFLAAAGITDPTITAAINTLVNDLIGYGIWNKMLAIYPFVGGTATTHKFNLKDPRDLDAAFRIVFNGGWTHTANGIQGNGTNTFGNTYFTPFLLPQNDASLGIYSRTNNINITQKMEMGVTSGSPDRSFSSSVRWDSSLGNLSRINSSFSGAKYIPTKTSGFFNVSRSASTITKLYEDGILKQTISDVSLPPVNLNLYIGARNTNNSLVEFYDQKQYAFAYLGESLTDTEAANYYIAVQAFQTTLGRQV